ncbi:MAG: Cyclic pyranopterin monophosphate synthase [Phycisphaerae bacterium]|nr:Cyclic pyranopterin monophosphate synthase [Phycisphaerae bacterium]
MADTGKRLTHLDDAGKISMVDVSAKSPTQRRAVASAVVRVGPAVFGLLMGEGVPKGDVFATARIAGILAAKRTPELIPLCHGLSPEFVDVRIEPLPPDALRITVETRVESKTGVEIDALVGATIAAVTIYDMCKSVSKDMVIGPIQLEEKQGGKSGPWRRDAK